MSQLEDTTRKRRKEHLNSEERKIIERMLRGGANKGEIARVLFRNKSTIKREIKRGSVIQRRQNPYASRNPNVPEYIEESVYFWDVGSGHMNSTGKTAGAKTRWQLVVSWYHS